MRRLVKCLAVLALVPLAGFGDGSDSDKPIDYSADHSEVFRDGRAILTGNVVLIQGQTRLKSDKLTIYFHSKDEKKPGTAPIAATAAPVSGFYRYIAEGSVFASSPDETASGDKAVFEVAAKTITVTGDVILTRGQNILRGKKLVIETATGRSRLDAEANGRVRGLFVPEEKSKPAVPK